MRDDKEIIEHLKVKCHIYKMERLTLLKVISDLTDMLYDKYTSQDKEDQVED